MNTRDVEVEVYRATAPYDRIDCDVEHTDANNVTLRFYTVPAANEYDVIILGAGTSGGPGSAVSYTHVQSTPASVWSINHPLSFMPNISLVDTADDVIEGDVSYDSPSLITVTYSGATGGKAYLS
jgi:hypothetical protein